MDGFRNWVQSAFGEIIQLYGIKSFPYDVASYMLAAAIGLLMIAVIFFLIDLFNIQRRCVIIKKKMGKNNPIDEKRRDFARFYNEIDEQLEKVTFGSMSLVLAWQEFKETLIDETANPISNTVRPQNFFNRSVKGPKWLDFYANVAVGVGLLFTFMGLVAALQAANQGLASGEMSGMQDSLRILLAASSAKFITSVTGIFISIILKLAQFGLTGITKKNVATLCQYIETGLIYMPPQALALRHVRQSEQQSELLKNLGTDIGLRFKEVLQPLSDTVMKAAAEQNSAISDGITQVIQDATGPELQRLASTLDNITGVMEGLEDKLRSSGESAAEHISSAASVLQTSLEGLPNKISEASQDAAENLRSVGKEAAESFVTTHVAFQGAAEQITAMQPVLERWENSTNSAMNNVSEALVGLSGHIQSLNNVSGELTAVGETLGSQLQVSEGRIQAAANASEAAIKQAEELHSAITETQEVLTSSWEAYSTRFEGVDTALGGVVSELSANLDAFKGKVQDQVVSLDNHMARAVANLAEGVRNLQDVIEDMQDK